MDSCSETETDSENLGLSLLVMECFIFDNTSLRTIGNKVKCKGCSSEILYNLVENKGNIGNLLKHLKSGKHVSHKDMLERYETAKASKVIGILTFKCKNRKILF